MYVIAYPYAQALFQLAKENNKEDNWLDILAQLKQIAEDANFTNLIHNPKFDAKQVIEIISGMLKNSDAEINGLLKVLAENNRLLVLNEIYIIFKDLVLADQNKAQAIIESAYELTKEQQADFEKILSQKFGKTITSEVKVKPELIGGIKVLINDKMIDASIKGRLANLASQLTK